MSERGSAEKPYYRKVANHSDIAELVGTQLYFIVCDEGWRESIVCAGMYDWAADWLVDQLQGKPYAAPPKASEVKP